MESTAKLQHARMSAQKARLVADQIRGLEISKALEYLDFHKKKAAISIKNVLNSAIANAEHNDGADIDELTVSKIYVDEGPTSKRMRPRAKGRGNRILQRTCHISVEVSDKKRQP